MSAKLIFKTVVISDVHLGSAHAKLEEATRFLNSVECDRLILAGDIIDGWQLRKLDDRWTVQKTAFFQAIMRMMENHGTEVIYVTGNHDDFLDPIVPSQLFNISLVHEYVIEEPDRRFVVIHGHAFDNITSGMRWIAKLGDVAYNFLLKFNKVWNRARARRGKEYYSLSKMLKDKVKKAVNAISGFESDLAEFAAAKGCSGIICGHIHRPEDKTLKYGIRYLNSGDWVESLSALTETMDGEWKIMYYKDLDC